MSLKRRGDVLEEQPKPSNPKKKRLTMQFDNTANGGYFDRSRNLRASSDAICPRIYFLRRNEGVHVTNDIWAELYMKMGNLIHKWFYKWMLSTEIPHIREYPYEISVGSTNMKGYIDLVCKDPHTGEYFIWDIKTVGIKPQSMNKGYRAQIAMYSLLTQIEDLAFIQIPRANPRKWDMTPVPYQESVLKHTLNSMARSMISYEMDLYPAPGGLITSYEDCQWCHHKDGCWSYDDSLDKSTDFRPREHKAFVEEYKALILKAAKLHREQLDANFDRLAKQTRQTPIGFPF